MGIAHDPVYNHIKLPDNPIRVVGQRRDAPWSEGFLAADADHDRLQEIAAYHEKVAR